MSKKRARSTFYKRLMAFVLSFTFVAQSILTVVAMPPPGEWSFAQLTVNPSNEMLSEAHSLATNPTVNFSRAFNPNVERAVLSFAMRYGQGATIGIYQLADGVSQQDVYTTDPRGDFIGYLQGEYNGVSHTFDFGGGVRFDADIDIDLDFDLDLDLDLDLDDKLEHPETAPDDEEVPEDFDVEEYPEQPEIPDDLPDDDDATTVLVAGVFRVLPFNEDELEYDNSENEKPVVDDDEQVNDEEEPIIDEPEKEEDETDEADEAPAFPEIISPIDAQVGGSRIGFVGYEGWLPELLIDDPFGLVDDSFVPTLDNFVNTILWEGGVADDSGTSITLESGSYVIVIQPVADSQRDYPIFLPFAIDNDLVPAIAGMPRGMRRLLPCLQTSPATTK